jgi:protein tyrosine phosphatase (PTP) superfamily phosphohydrolase (DUF442 family)
VVPFLSNYFTQNEFCAFPSRATLASSEMNTRLAHLTILSFILFVAVAGNLCAQTDPPQQAPTGRQSFVGEKLHVRGLPNFGKINDRLYRGAQPQAAGLEELKKLGITTIVDLRGEDREKVQWEKKRAESLGIRFIHIPVSGWSPPADSQVAQFLSIFRGNSDEKVFVHCRLGDDRTGVFVATYRIAFDKFLSDEALHEMYIFGFNGVWHPPMATFVREFPRRLASDTSLAPFKPVE